MIKKVPSMVLLSYVALTLGGCGLFQGGQDPSEEPPVAESPQPPEEKPDEEVFEETESTPSTPQPPAAQGLIPSTTPSERRKNIQTGRANPFAVIPIKPVIREKASENGASDPERLCKLEEVKTPPTTIAQAPTSATTVSDVGLPPLLDPVLPIPNEARGVLVSGVMQLNGTSVAIVKAPNEKVARQVTVGASLSNGQVKVKAINVSSQRPYIVLEQYGLEIPRGVGEPAEEPVEPPTPTLPDGTPQPVAAAEPSIPAPGPDGFGTVRNVTLLTLNIGNVALGEDEGEETQTRARASGIICNEGFSPVTVKKLSLQVEDKASGAVLDSVEVFLGDPDIGYTIGPGQKAEVDGTIPKLRGRKQEDVNIKLIGWS
ncbi:MAG: hypothetical protein QNJ37_22095 [Crocosphaera sp.]|nr:hypothetical protein [Crocosphaera sp.]